MRLLMTNLSLMVTQKHVRELLREAKQLLEQAR